ncbi:TetR/AcrR family transcriptional regulator [Paenibacillus sp. CAU 1782]
MPKIVNHEEQRRLVAEAALRVIKHSGLEEATVRKVAKEAGLSVGSMRHYFSTQAELYIFCMNLIAERVEERLGTLPYGDNLLSDLRGLLLQFLPIDEERVMEMEVWFVFQSKMLAYPELKTVSSSVQNGIYKASLFVLDELEKNKLLRPELNIELEAEKLYALIDGLAIHRVLHPNQLSVEQMDKLLESHLLSLCS